MTVQAQKRWKDNGELIADVAKLGYLKDTDLILDATYGEGTFWKQWWPTPQEFESSGVFACDKNLDVFERLRHSEEEKRLYSWSWKDFTDLPDFWADRFDAVVLDPPYKLNGTPDETVDARYGVHEPTRWQERMALIHAGIRECARVVKPKGTFLLKCQDQVCSGKMRWQTFEFTQTANEVGLDLIDRFDLLGHSRPQPMKGRKQKHAHGRGSTLLVYRRVKP